MDHQKSNIVNWDVLVPFCVLLVFSRKVDFSCTIGILV